MVVLVSALALVVSASVLVVILGVVLGMAMVVALAVEVLATAIFEMVLLRGSQKGLGHKRIGRWDTSGLESKMHLFHCTLYSCECNAFLSCSCIQVQRKCRSFG
jgi:hypothetical protein